MDIAAFENDRWKKRDQTLEFRHRAALALAHGTSLDVGCGDGLLLGLLKKQGVHAIGADISEVGIEKCREKGFEAKQFDGSTLPFPDASFDTVIALDVLEHLYRPELLLRELKRVSNKSVIIGVPNFVSLPARIQVLLGYVPENNRPHLGHIYWFTRHVLIKLAQKEGLVVADFRANTLWDRLPRLSLFTRFACRLAPSLFGLSFVVRFERT